MVRVKSVLGLVALALFATLGFAPSMAAAALPPVYYQLNGLSFANPTTGFIAGGYALPATPGNLTGVISRTTNGGVSWHASIVPNFTMTGVRASTNPNIATAWRDNSDGIYSTSNGGAIWSVESPIFNATDPRFFGMAYLSAGRRVIVGDRFANSRYAFIGSAVGAGAWAFQFQGPIHPAVDPDPAPATFANIVAVDAASGGDVAWAVGNDRQSSNDPTPQTWLIYRTANSGSSWTTQIAGTPTADISCVSVVDSRTAFIGTRSKAGLCTTDGATWRTFGQTTPIVVNAIDAFDANHVVEVGDAGKMAWTTNGGASWQTTTTTGATNNLTGVQMLTSTTWVVIGHNETILRTVDGGQHWIGQHQLTPPSVRITSPTQSTILDSAALSVEGTATDGAGIGVANVEIRVRRADGTYWNGASWGSTVSWLPAKTSTGWDTWEATTTIDSIASVNGSLTVTVRATDGMGQISETHVSSKLVPAFTLSRTGTIITAYNTNTTITGTIKASGLGLASGTVYVRRSGSTALTAVPITAGSAFSFTVKPSSATSYWVVFNGNTTVGSGSSAVFKLIPHAYVGTPSVPTYMTRTKYFTTRATLYPRHVAGTYAATFYFERYERLSNGTHRYVVRKTISGKAANYYSGSRCSVSVKLGAGKWRVQARHWDTGHAKTYSVARKYFTVH